LALKKTFVVLRSVLMARPTEVQLFCDALDHKLLRALVICGRGPNGSKMDGFINLFLEVLMPPQLVYPKVLSALDSALDDVNELVAPDDFKDAKMYDHWVPFSNLAEDRIAILKSCEAGETPSMRACDNLEVMSTTFELSLSVLIHPKCGEIRPRHEFTRCSACKSVYYCDEACQTVDWVGGGHRSACKSYVALSLREYQVPFCIARLNCNLHPYPSGAGNALDFAMRSFLRALIHHDYHKAKRTIRLQKIVFHRPSPDGGFLTLYDYTQGPVKINLQLLNSAKTHEVLGSTERTNIVSRAERSGGRMGLDVLVFSGREEYHYYAISLRSNRSTVNDGLRALGDELPPDVENWDESFFEDRFQRFLDSNDEDKELVEIH
jgi:hypothetical protein